MNAACPVPESRYARIVLGHGSGGRLSQALLEQVFLPHFAGEILAGLEDQAELALPTQAGARLAFTTDSFVVSPLFFPGGDIGRLAVCGTVNDLCVGGAVPHSLSAAFVLEEGLLIEDLKRIVASMAATCREAGVEIVTGDTKVVERGKADGVFITTSGVGVLPAGRALSISGVRPGDALVVSGPIGDHGVAILSVREGIDFETELLSDCAPLSSLTRAIFELGIAVRCMRDPTRGGLSGVLQDMADTLAGALLAGAILAGAILVGPLGRPRRHDGSALGCRGEPDARFFSLRPDGLGRYWHRRTPSGSGLAEADRAGPGPPLHFE